MSSWPNTRREMYWSLASVPCGASRDATAGRGGDRQHLIRRRAGSLFPNIGAYRSTKFAMEGMSWTLFFEVSHFGIRVLDVQPGAGGDQLRYHLQAGRTRGDGDKPVRSDARSAG